MIQTLQLLNFQIYSVILFVEVEASITVLGSNIAVVKFSPGVSVISLNHLPSLGAIIEVSGSTAKITFPSHITLVSQHSVSSKLGFTGKLTIVRFISSSSSRKIGVSIEGASEVCPSVGESITLIPVTPIKASVSFGKLTPVGPKRTSSQQKITIKKVRFTKKKLG